MQVVFIILSFMCTIFGSLPARSELVRVPGVYSIDINRGPGSDRVIAAVPLALLEDHISHAIKKGVSLNSDFELIIHTLEFDRSTPAELFRFTAHLEVTANLPLSPRANCKVIVEFALPTAAISDLKLQALSVPPPDCAVSGFLGQFFNDKVAAKIQNALKDALSPDKTKLDVLSSPEITNDRELPGFLRSGFAQGKRCTQDKQLSLCFFLAWSPRSLDEFKQKLLNAAPTPTRPAELSALKGLLTNWRSAAPRKPSKTYPGYSYPAEETNGVFGDGDMTIFGGLSCLGGEDEACIMVSRAQGSNGQWWRSPDRVGDVPDIKNGGSAQFSGDQLKGVIAYFLKTILTNPKDTLGFLDAKEKFRKFLFFIANQKVSVAGSIPPEHGYLSCVVQDNPYTCLLTGWDWIWLNRLAAYFDSQDIIPKDEASPVARYGYTDAVMELEAMLYPLGYRMHLIGIQVLLERKISGDTKKLERVAAILASREPANAFYLFLHLGKDQRVMDQLSAKCAAPTGRPERNDWAWQRGEYDKAWERSMVWDCVFIGNLLAN